MENLLFFLATTFAWRLSSSHKRQQCQIGHTGCSLLFLKGSPFEFKKTATGDDLYFNVYSEKAVVYGAICVALTDPLNLSEASFMLADYMNKLKDPFLVNHEVGLEASKDWNQAGSVCLVDHWQDAGGVDCKVKGYTDGQVMAVLYVKNICAGEVSKQEEFLDSFHFKGACKN